MKKVLLLTVVVLALAGCSLIPDRTLVYQQAEPAPRMEVPEGMVFLGEQDIYPVDQQEKTVTYTGERFTLPEPPRLSILGRDGADDVVPEEPAQTRVTLTKDGNGFPIIMMETRFHWAWEHLDTALGKTDLRVNDRNRDSGIFFVRVPSRYGLSDRDVQIKLSHTVNGIQVAVLNRRGTSLVDREPGEAILQRLYQEL